MKTVYNIVIAYGMNVNCNYLKTFGMTSLFLSKKQQSQNSCCVNTLYTFAGQLIDHTQVVMSRLIGFNVIYHTTSSFSIVYK